MLNEFYRKFTLSYVIRKMAEEINESKKWLVEAGAYLSRRLDKEEYARRVFEYAEEEDIEYVNPKRICEKEVEDILVLIIEIEKEYIRNGMGTSTAASGR